MVTVQGNFVQFRFYRPVAKSVSVVGDFTNWQDGKVQMTLSPDGHWTALLKLPAGSHKFRYRADGQWYTDFAAFGIEYSEHGGIDSVVVVPSETQSVRRLDIPRSAPVADSKVEGNDRAGRKRSAAAAREEQAA